MAIDRSIWDHPAFRKDPFTEREAWIWIISHAAWKDQEIRMGDYMIQLERGQLCYSIRYMAKAWKWDKSKVARYLKRLEGMKMTCSKTETANETAPKVIIVNNYNHFQPDGQGSVRQQPRQQPRQHRDSTETNNKKDKKDKKIRDTEVSLGHFERFWDLYPRKIGKGQAQRAWMAAVKKVDPAVIVEGLELHLEDLSGKDREFTPHPATWLNGERWADELERDTFWDTFSWENSK